MTAKQLISFGGLHSHSITWPVEEVYRLEPAYYHYQMKYNQYWHRGPGQEVHFNHRADCVCRLCRTCRQVPVERPGTQCYECQDWELRQLL